MRILHDLDQNEVFATSWIKKSLSTEIRFDLFNSSGYTKKAGTDGPSTSGNILNKLGSSEAK